MNISEQAFWYLIALLSVSLVFIIWLLIMDKSDKRYYEEMQRKYANGELNANT